MTVAYFDCFGGASGDMICGALLDAGVRIEQLREALSALDLPGWEISAETVTRAGLAGTKFHVLSPEGSAVDALPDPEAHEHPHPHEAAPHDHGNEHSHAHNAHPHPHPHPHEAKPHAHPHGPHRNLTDILAMLDAAGLPERADGRARRIFRRLAEAEGRVHNMPPEQVHFHEVGAVDSIIDIVGAVLAMELLNIERVISSPIPLGTGHVRCAHGLMPVPAPATVELMRDGAIAASDYPKELCTPTGAAILTTLAESFGALPAMAVDAIGYGAGGRDDPGRSNMLRVFVGQVGAGEADSVVELVANIDDTTGQVLGATLELLIAAGALDAWIAPIVMKKSRPAHQIGVLCSTGDVERLEAILFAETTTIGVRRTTCARTKLRRRHETVQTPFGPVRMKISSGPAAAGPDRTATPEFDDCRTAAEAHGVAIRAVQLAAEFAWRSARTV